MTRIADKQTPEKLYDYEFFQNFAKTATTALSEDQINQIREYRERNQVLRQMWAERDYLEVIASVKGIELPARLKRRLAGL